MGKYGALISQAKAGADAESEGREDVIPATRKPVKRKAVNTELRKHVKTATRKAVKAERRKAGKRESVRWADTTGLVTVGTKAPADVAQHWVVEAKRQGVSMTYVITRALIEAFGAPDGAILEDEE